jgi:serine/threonine-protein kinase
VKKIPLSPGSETRAAALAISRYGADPRRVDLAIEEVRQARLRQEPLDLLDLLMVQQLLTPAQAEELRQECTTEAPAAETPLAGGALSASAGRPGSPLLNGPGPRDPVATPSGHHLRSLGEFRLLRRLGQGGMGSVFLAYDEAHHRHVAVKVLSDQLASNRAYVERFYREAKSGALLDHPNIVHCIRAGQDKTTGKHYLVLEYVDGPSAHALLERMGRLSVGDAVHVILDIARGLEHVHSRNIIHRDIKPDNILITQSGVAKLADLGLAKRMDEVSHLTGLRVGFGTLDYIPYEQAINAKQADVRSDIYALGATLYHLVTGEVPFPAKSYMEVAEKKVIGKFTPASELNPEVPPVLDRILAKMLAAKPDDRYQMVSALIVDLERAGLAAPVPSFADPALAMQDPLVRERLAEPAQPTQLDLQSQLNRKPNGNGPADIWFVRFRNSEGQWIKTKLTARQVMERLQAGRLGKEVEVARQASGDFRPLADFPEFHEAANQLAPPSPSPIPAPPGEEDLPVVATEETDEPTGGFPWLLAATVALGLIVIALLVLVLFKLF